jgi:hypothetical protein
MMRCLGAFVVAAPLLVASAAAPALAQKQGGILKMYSPDSPASMSIHEETTIVSERPMMGVFNNLVMFDQHVKQNSLQSIVPDLAISWSWNASTFNVTDAAAAAVRGTKVAARASPAASAARSNQSHRGNLLWSIMSPATAKEEI